MSEILAVRVSGTGFGTGAGTGTDTDTDTDTDTVQSTAEAIAALLGAQTAPLDLVDVEGPSGTSVPDASPPVRQVLAALERPTTAFAVIPDVNRFPTAWPILQHARKPVVIAPKSSPERTLIERALVSLDGTVEVSEALAKVIRLLIRAGVQVVLLHVFEASTVPRYWDQTAHAEQAWADQLAGDFSDEPRVSPQWRTGIPAASLLDAAERERVGLIVLGWRQQLAPGRARTLRRAIANATVPVLVVPVASLQ